MKTWSDTGIFWLPLASFSSDLDEAKYSLEVFWQVDVARTVAMNHRVSTRLLMAREDVSDTLRSDSVLVGKHREFRGPRASSFPEAAGLADKLRKGFPFQLTIHENRIVDGLGEWAGAVDALSGPEYRSFLSEVAIRRLLPLE